MTVQTYMRNALFAVTLILAAGTLLHAQSDVRVGNITSTSSSITLTSSNSLPLASYSINVRGTWSGTIVVSVANRSGTYSTGLVLSVGGTASQSSITANGTYVVLNTVAITSVNVAAPVTWNSGTAVITITGSTGSSGAGQGASAFTPCYVKSGTGTVNDTSNHANCKSSAGTFLGSRAINTSATLAYLRLYNLAGDPTCSSSTGFVESIPIPASATGAGYIDVMSNFNYDTGIAYCVTGGGANNNNDAPPAGVYITLTYQ